MRKVREILRLHASQLSQHQISRSLNISSGVVNKYIKLAEKAGVVWPLPESGDKELRDLLMPQKKSCSSFTLPDYNWIYSEFKHKGVTFSNSQFDLLESLWGFEIVKTKVKKSCQESNICMEREKAKA